MSIIQVTARDNEEVVDPILQKLSNIKKFPPLAQPSSRWTNLWRRETYPANNFGNESSIFNISDQLLKESLYTFTDRFKNKSNAQIKVLVDNQKQLQHDIISIEETAPRYLEHTLNVIQTQEYEHAQFYQTINQLHKDVNQLQTQLNNIFLHLNDLHENLELVSSEICMDARKYPNLSILLTQHKNFNSSISQTPTPILSPTNPLARTSIDIQHSFSTTQLQLHQPKSYNSPKLPSPTIPVQKTHKPSKFFNLKSSMSLMNMKAAKAQQPPKKMSNAHEHLAKIATATNSNKKFNTLNTKNVAPATGPFLSRLFPNLFTAPESTEKSDYYNPHQSKTIGKDSFGTRKELVDWDEWRSMALDSS